MPAFIAALLGGLVLMAGPIAGRVVLALGFGAVTYAGVSTTLAWLKSQVLGALTGLSADMLGLLAFLKVGEAISIVFSALLVRLVLNGLSDGGSISRLVKR
jgi:hypothetical protein